MRSCAAEETLELQLPCMGSGVNSFIDLEYTVAAAEAETETVEADVRRREEETLVH